VSARRRHLAIAFKFKVAPAFAHCDGCGAALAGLRSWQWSESGTLVCACRACVFPRDPRAAAALEATGALS
jgi:hypothetical protein